jgi:cobalt-zinc-cadmium efflux system protein
MTHSHNHTHQHSHSDASSNIGIAFFLNLAFTIIEVIGGLYTNSISILSDALHDFGDSFSLALAWYFQRLSRRKADAVYSYGYRRFSLLGAFINSLVLFAGSIFVIKECFERIVSPQPVNAHGMLLLAIIGIAVNGAAMLRLRRGNSLNERTVSLHLLEDVLGWAAVLVGSVIMSFTDLPIIDPLLSLAIACFILFNIYRNLSESLRVILQGTPEDVSYRQVEEALASIPEVIGIHDLHLWTMDGQYNILSVHLVIKSDTKRESHACIKKNARDKLRAIGIQHSTLELEETDENCGMAEDCCSD